MVNAHCGYRIETELTGGNGIYLVFWAQSRLALQLRLIAQDDGAVLWEARHDLARSQGGVPLSPMTAPLLAYQATAFGNDGEQVYSMIDDALRRMWETFSGRGMLGAAD